MALEKKKKIKKTKKQYGGLINNYPLDTIFRFRRPNKNLKNFITNTSNRLLREPKRIAFIKEIKELLLSPEYQKNIPVFYGNQSTKNNEKYNGYNEYVCRTILGSLGVISSKRRIFIINPFAEFVYRITIFCFANNYKNNIDKLENLLQKLLKLDNFKIFPKIVYLPYGIRFCIVKDEAGIEKVITSKDPNISSCSLVSGCSLMMSAEIREENLPSEQDIIELYDIINGDYKLLTFCELSKNKAKYNRISNKNYNKNKLVKDDYFTNIFLLFRYLDELQNLFIQSKQNDDYIKLKSHYKYYIQELYYKIQKSNISFPELKANIDTLISQVLSKETLQYSILLKILEFVINQIKTNKNDFDVFLSIFEEFKKKYELSENKYFQGIFNLLLLLNDLKNQILQLNLYNESIFRIENNSYNRKRNIIKNQQNIRQKIISPKLTNILLLQNLYIPQLQQLYNYVKLQLQQPNVNLLEVSTKLIQEIITLLKSTQIQYQQFLLFLEKKPIEKLKILQILGIN